MGDGDGRDGRGRGRRGTEVRVDVELEAAPLHEDARRVPRVGEAHLGPGPGRDAHALRASRCASRCVEILDLERDRVHAATMARDELAGGAVDDRLADFDGVVADPGHAAPPADAGFGGLAVLEHPEPGQETEAIDGQVVVGHHGRRVEQPAHGVTGHA